MKLTTILILLSLMQVSAATFAQTLTMKQSKASLREIFNQIKLQTGYGIVVKSERLEQPKTINIDFKSLVITEVLNKILPEYDLDYTIMDKTIIIKPIASEPSLLDDLIARFRAIDPKGKIVDSLGTPLIGASVAVKGTNRVARTNEKGDFYIQDVDEKAILVISYLGYESREVKATSDMGTITLKQQSSELNEVVINTGYQSLPKERATGSFVQVDQTLLNRSVSTNVLDRLKDVVPGLTFNNGVGVALSRENDLSIRGRSTLFAKADPLIVLDNFPFEGALENINPNDIESITVLKDASAASIWGAKAGNGVIVITTKKGKYGQALQVQVNANVTFSEKPDLFQQPNMSSADYIEVEKILFAKNYYKSTETSLLKNPLSPVVELLIAKRDNKINPTLADAQIEALKEFDVRHDLQKYFYRTGINKQYSVNLNGGTDKQKFLVGLGYDDNTSITVGEGFKRITARLNNTYKMLHDRLEITAGIYFTSGLTRTDNTLSGISLNNNGLYPYAELANSQGNALPFAKFHRLSYVNGLETTQPNLLSWKYYPLDELAYTTNTNKKVQYDLQGAARYQIIPGLSANLLYQYSKADGNRTVLQSQDSYYTRDQINRFSEIASDGSVIRPIPLGGIRDLGLNSYYNYSLRGQLNFDKRIKVDHEFNAIAGYEIRHSNTISNQTRQYGYDDEHATAAVTDYKGFYKLFVNPATTSQITNVDAMTDETDRFISYYVNGGYGFKQRYLLNFSARLDRSNIFGVKTNQQGVPLWSAGIAWEPTKESFYKLSWLPYLKLRLTYGYNGNVNNSLSAYTTARYENGSGNGNNLGTGLPYATVINPPNPELRWEKVKIINLGLDFGTKNNRISGSIEYFHKNGLDLIGTSPISPTTGISSFTGNSAYTSGKGVDLMLHSVTIKGSLGWETDYLFSYVNDKVDRYFTKSVNNVVTDYVQNRLPLEGKPQFAIFSFPSAGLDPNTGESRGYLNGEISKDYTKLVKNATLDDVIYHGSRRPVVFGALRNTVRWKQLSASCNISYRMGYYFRRTSVNYGVLLTAKPSHSDYALRWQKPGDEAFTTVPSLPASTNTNRNTFQLFVSDLVEKGDHVRLQDATLNYDLKAFKKRGIKTLGIYGYASNLGVIWKASKKVKDPDYPSGISPSTSYALGVRAQF